MYPIYAQSSKQRGFALNASKRNVKKTVSRREWVVRTSFFGVTYLWTRRREAKSVQGYTAGRIPGVNTELDNEGFFVYERPQDKSGGHGVGWTEIPRYSFRIPPGWEEMPVSIADPGGAEIDLRFGNEAEGNLEVVVAPVLRFLDVDPNEDIRIDQIGDPQKVIEGFAPELFGAPLEEGDVLATEVIRKGSIPYYIWHKSLLRDSVR